MPPPGADAPLEQTSPLGADTPPLSRHPQEKTPPRADTPLSRPPREADSCIRSTSGRYASYWNAFLLVNEMVPRNVSLNNAGLTFSSYITNMQTNDSNLVAWIFQIFEDFFRSSTFVLPQTFCRSQWPTFDCTHLVQGWGKTNEH